MVIQDKKLPWFKLYANDFIVKTVGLTNEQVGIYVKLLAYTWAYGPQPNDLKVINSIVQGGEATEVVLARFFDTNEQGKLYEPSLDVLRIESLESAEINRKRTAAATAAAQAAKAAKAAAKEARAAKAKAKLAVTEPSRNRHDAVTGTELRGRGKSGEEKLQKDEELQRESKESDGAPTLPEKPSDTQDEKSSVEEFSADEISAKGREHYRLLDKFEQIDRKKAKRFLQVCELKKAA